MAKTLKHQAERGFALFWLAAVLAILGGGGWLTTQHKRTVGSPHDATQQALVAAKNALLGYAASYPELRQKDTKNRLAYVYGHLPCPNLENTANPGQEAIQCEKQGVSSLGRLPWSSLGLPPLKDESGECLWYAVSGNYKANPKADLLNPDVLGQFIIQATVNNPQIIADDVVAVVIAPGPLQPNQSRPLLTSNQCSSDLNPANFLDAYSGGSNAVISGEPEGFTYFVQAGQANPSLNDRMIWITRKELFDVIGQRANLRNGTALFDPLFATSNVQAALTQRVAECLREFAIAGSDLSQQKFGRLPWAAPMALTAAAPETFKNDRFNDKKNLMAGRMPMFLWDTKQALGTSHVLGTFNQCSHSSDTDCRLFRTDNCPNLLPVAGYKTPSDSVTEKDSPDGWLDKWKDHLFYGVAQAYQPSTGFSDACQSNNCLQVNGRTYAAIILYAGAALVGQNRLSSSGKQNPLNYLEGENATSVTQNGRVFASEGNDQMVCLRPDLTLAIGCID